MRDFIEQSRLSACRSLSKGLNPASLFSCRWERDSSPPRKQLRQCRRWLIQSLLATRNLKGGIPDFLRQNPGKIVEPRTQQPTHKTEQRTGRHRVFVPGCPDVGRPIQSATSHFQDIVVRLQNWDWAGYRWLGACFSRCCEYPAWESLQAGSWMRA